MSESWDPKQPMLCARSKAFLVQNTSHFVFRMLKWGISASVSKFETYLLVIIIIIIICLDLNLLNEISAKIIMLCFYTFNQTL